MLVMSQTGFKDVLLFSLNHINLISCALIPWEWQEIESVQPLPWASTKVLRVLPPLEASEKALWFPVYGAHHGFAHRSRPHGILKASLSTVGSEVLGSCLYARPSRHPSLRSAFS